MEADGGNGILLEPGGQGTGSSTASVEGGAGEAWPSVVSQEGANPGQTNWSAGQQPQDGAPLGFATLADGEVREHALTYMNSG